MRPNCSAPSTVWPFNCKHHIVHADAGLRRRSVVVNQRDHCPAHFFQLEFGRRVVIDIAHQHAQIALRTGVQQRAGPSIICAIPDDCALRLRWHHGHAHTQQQWQLRNYEYGLKKYFMIVFLPWFSSHPGPHSLFDGAMASRVGRSY